MIELQKTSRSVVRVLSHSYRRPHKFEMRQTEGRLYTPSSVPFGEKNLTMHVLLT